MKKILLTIILLGSSTLNINAAFSDITSDYIYIDAVNYVQTQSIVNGYSDGTFRAEQPITRGEFTKIIMYASLGDNATGNCFDTPFSDVDSNWKDDGKIDTFAIEICHAYENHLISGYTDGTFRADENITVEQASKIITKAFGLIDDSNIKIDQNNKFGPYMAVLISKRALPNEIYTRTFPLTRGQMAETIYRLKNNITDKCGYADDICPIAD